MKLLKTKIILIAAVIFSLTLGEAWGVASFAQNVGINTTGNAPNSSALLDINASPGNDKGILIPRLPLTATNSGTPISPAPGVAETGLMVFNTATAGVPPNDVVPGFYFWNGTAWAPLGGGGALGAGGWTDDGTVVRLTTSTDFVGIGTASPAATSALDITSTTKGLLIPRMTTTQRDAITTPATGLQVYNTDCKVLEYWSGSCWISMSKAINDPDAISSSGTTVFCAGQVRTYTIAAVTGATYYNWTVPAGTVITSGQGTTSISATFGNISGSVCVKARNACETSGQTCLAVSVDPIPNTPGNITGPSSINPGQLSVNYFIASVNGASAYTWAYSGTGLTIASGTGTTSIVVNFACNATAGNLTVTANSTCGASTASSLALTVTPFLAVSAGAAVFGGTSQTIGSNATGGTSGYTYAWSPTSDLSSSTIATPIAQCTGATTTYTVTAADSRSCTATSTVVVTRNLVVNAGAAKFGGTTIGGTATGGNATYTYLWSPTTDLSSATVAVPTALCTGSTTTYTVTATDANSCAATSNVIVTRNLAVNAGAAKFGGTTIGATATGGNATYTYLWSPTTNLSSSTVAVPTALCTGSTTTYTVTATDANSCTALSNVVVTRNLTASAGANQTVTCSGVAIGGSPTATGGNATYTYSWSPSTGLSSSTIANPTASSSGSTTTYTVTVTDANACTATSSMILTRSGCTVTFNNTSTGTTGTIQNWTVPAGVTSINIEVWGSQGGGNTGGLGARMKGTFTVTPGQVLKILVGQMGQGISSRGGGGGGSFVTDNSNNPLIIGGGGGGSDNGCNPVAGMPGVVTGSGTSYGSSMSGGVGSNGGGGGGGQQGSGGGGGGLLGNGGSGEACAYSGSSGAGGNGTNGSSASGGGGCYPPGGLSFTNGGTGGSSSVNGGYGGGGSAYSWNCGGGGGGGYSGGGGGGYQSIQEPGGGGGSYNNGTSQSNTGGVKTGHGQVVITY